MDKEEILQKSREENAAGYMDERIGEAAALVLFGVKISRGQPAADILTLVTGMSAAGFFYRVVKNRKKSDVFWAVLCTVLALFYLCRFFVGVP